MSVRSPELNDGKSLVPAIFLVTVVAILIFILTRAFFIDQDFIGSIYENGVPRSLAGFILVAFPYIHQRLVGKRRRNISNLPDDAVPFDAYTLPWYTVLIYGIFLAFAISGLSLLLIWLMGLATAFFLTRAISTLNWIFLLIAFYYLGSWAGTRNTNSPFVLAIGIVLGYTILELFLSVALDIDSSLRGPLGLVIFLIPALVAALTGARTGKRRRFSNYVHFLLSLLPEADRQTVVENLFREVRQRISDKH